MVHNRDEIMTHAHIEDCFNVMLRLPGDVTVKRLADEVRLTHGDLVIASLRTAAEDAADLADFARLDCLKQWLLERNPSFRVVKAGLVEFADWVAIAISLAGPDRWTQFYCVQVGLFEEVRLVAASPSLQDLAWIGKLNEAPLPAVEHARVNEHGHFSFFPIPIPRQLELETDDGGGTKPVFRSTVGIEELEFGGGYTSFLDPKSEGSVSILPVRVFTKQEYDAFLATYGPLPLGCSGLVVRQRPDLLTAEWVDVARVQWRLVYEFLPPGLLDQIENRLKPQR